MKNLLLLMSMVICTALLAQQSVTITPQQYDVLKQNNQLNASTLYQFINNGAVQSPVPYSGPLRSPSTICSCEVPLDTTFSVVPFNSGTAPDYRNDDGSSPAISLPFTFNFYGVNYTSVYINNNGNVSFGSGYATFISSPFPSANYKMITPLWADFDTRNPASGLVYYKVTPTAIIVKWDGVGYFPSNASLTNTFQLILTDGSDPILPAGTNVSFCYGDMQWTNGGNGLGGTPATAGVNQGNNVDFFQIGRFDHEGTSFDGPYGANDSVSWLDNQGMYFDVSMTSNPGNIAPVVINNTICDTIDVFTGDTLRTTFTDYVNFTIGASTPEQNQTVTVSFTSSDPTHLTSTLTKNSATYKEYDLSFDVTNLPAGLHYVTITATDDGTPAATTVHTVVIRSAFDGTLTSVTNLEAQMQFGVYPNPANNELKFAARNFKANTISISNVLGKNVLNYNAATNLQSIDISTLPSGIYFVNATDANNNSKTVKFIKK